MSDALTKDNAVDRLREIFPHGHPAFLPTTLREIQLHSDKNHDYAKGGSPLGNFERVSAILALYPKLQLSDMRVVALVYALKQVDAVLWGLSEGIEHKVEGLNDRLQDISVYSKIVMCMNLGLPTPERLPVVPVAAPPVQASPQSLLYGEWPWPGRSPLDPAEQDHEPRVPEQCGEVKPGELPVTCGRPKGHDGDHVAFLSDGNICGRWQQEPQAVS